MKAKISLTFFWCFLVHVLLEAVLNLYFVNYLDCAYNILKCGWSKVGISMAHSRYWRSSLAHRPEYFRINPSGTIRSSKHHFSLCRAGRRHIMRLHRRRNSWSRGNKTMEFEHPLKTSEMASQTLTGLHKKFWYLCLLGLNQWICHDLIFILSTIISHPKSITTYMWTTPFHGHKLENSSSYFGVQNASSWVYT
jgi:hypothetical protein